MNIVILGNGNVATILGRRAVSAGHKVLQVYGRNKENTTRLAAELGAKPVELWKEIFCSDALLYLVCLPDAVLYSLRDNWKCSQGIVVHTSGSTPAEVLREVSPNFGVLYPLQSLTVHTSPTIEIPLLIEANTPDDTALLQDFACTLSNQVTHANSQERLRFHLAAVLVNNFTNHLYQHAFEWLQMYHQQPRLLLPLINETANRLTSQSPASVQTGPALRGDAITLEKHEEMLAGNSELLEVYRLFSRLIQQAHHKTPALV